MKNKIDHYYEISLRGLKDTIPKIIGKFFLKEVEVIILNKIY